MVEEQSVKILEVQYMKYLSHTALPYRYSRRDAETWRILVPGNEKYWPHQ